MKWLLLLGFAVGCADPCVDGVCENTGGGKPQPGPCESAYASADYSNHCTYSYDGTRLAQVDCTYSEDSTTGTETTTYATDGSIHGLRVQSDGTVDTDDLWTFDAANVTHKSTRFGRASVSTYDRATFAFLPTDPGELPWPRAELGLQKYVQDDGGGLMTIVNFTWTTDGNQLKRSSGHFTDTFGLDDQHRIISWEDVFSEISVPDEHKYAYSGEHLARHAVSGELTIERFQTATYHYDHGGNLVGFSADETNNEAGYQAAYSYTCW